MRGQRRSPVSQAPGRAARAGTHGHPVVGAVSLAPQEFARARAACEEIIKTLNT